MVDRNIGYLAFIQASAPTLASRARCAWSRFLQRDPVTGAQILGSIGRRVGMSVARWYASFSGTGHGGRGPGGAKQLIDRLR